MEAKPRPQAVKLLVKASDVLPGHLKIAEQVFDDWFSDDTRIDWESFIDRMADPTNAYGEGAFDFEQYDNPAIRKIQRHIRAYKDQSW
jgi:hypothetical protein